jgi:hypothetical protein
LLKTLMESQEDMASYNLTAKMISSMPTNKPITKKLMQRESLSTTKEVFLNLSKVELS